MSGPLPPAPPQFDDDDAQWWPSDVNTPSSEAGAASRTAGEGGITSGSAAGPSLAHAAWDDEQDEGEGMLIADEGGGVVPPMAAVTGLGRAPRVANPNPNPSPNPNPNPNPNPSPSPSPNPNPYPNPNSDPNPNHEPLP